MRRRLGTLVGGLVMGACLYDAASAETGSRWWPFGRSEAEESQPPIAGADSGVATPHRVEQQAPSPQTPVDEEPEQRWMIDSPLAKVSWPRFQFPDVAKPQLPRPQFWPEKTEVDAARNAWVEQDPNATQPSPLQAVTDGFRRAGDSTRAAWHKTVDALTPGDGSGSSSSRVARREARPPWWKKMFGTDEEPQGPQTVTEWMAQERIDP